MHVPELGNYGDFKAVVKTPSVGLRFEQSRFDQSPPSQDSLIEISSEVEKSILAEPKFEKRKSRKVVSDRVSLLVILLVFILLCRYYTSTVS